LVDGVGLAAGFAVPVPLAVTEPVVFCPVEEVPVVPPVFVVPVVLPVFAGPVVPAAPAPLVGAPVVPGVVDGGGVGNELSGVGASGRGFVRTLATSSFNPASDLLRYL
jgi:hypothetical protein